MESTQYYKKQMLKMDYLSKQISTVDMLPTARSAQFFGNKLKQLNMSLLAETALIIIVAVLAVKIFGANSTSGNDWFMVPCILVAAAIIPTAIKKGKFAKIGFNIRQVRDSLVVLGWTCIVVFPATFSCCWLLKSYGLGLPLRPILPDGQGWACWLFYQFMYVAIAEEVFFRGYVQNNILELTSKLKLKQCWLQQWISITLSASCFAIAHIIVQGQIISVLTFLPGLVLGWLFIRTKSLLAPILFHGLANTCYCIIAAALA